MSDVLSRGRGGRGKNLRFRRANYKLVTIHNILEGYFSTTTHYFLVAFNGISSLLTRRHLCERATSYLRTSDDWGAGCAFAGGAATRVPGETAN